LSWSSSASSGRALIGVGLLIGTFFGRAHGLIALGVLAIPILLVTAVVHVPLSGVWGERDYAPISLDEVRAEYGLSGGSLRLDLRNLDEVGIRCIKVP